MTNMIGIWDGEVVYGPAYLDIAGKLLLFEMLITEADEESFVGISKDIGGVGVSPDEAKISGFAINNTISFIKKYKRFHFFSEEGEILFDDNKKGVEIVYSGIYNEFEKKFEGEWEIVISSEQVGENWLDESCAGTWSIKKRQHNGTV